MLQHNNVHGLCKTIVWENYMSYYISTVVKPCFILAQYFNIWKGKSISVKSVKTLWPAKNLVSLATQAVAMSNSLKQKKFCCLFESNSFFYLTYHMHFKTKKVLFWASTAQRPTIQAAEFNCVDFVCA